MSYALCPHTADVAVEATGTGLGAAFAAAADGMAAAMCADPPGVGDRREIAVTAESRAGLLFDYLDELIYERDVRSVLPVDNAGRVEQHDGRWHFEGAYRGVPLDLVDARDLKAVTYSEMDIEEGPDGWRVYVVFDV